MNDRPPTETRKELRHPKKILMTADTLGGVWTYALELSRALGDRGIEIGLATMGAPLTKMQRSEVRSLPNVTVFESSYKLEWMPDPWTDVECAGQWLLDLEDQFQPDLVHLNGYAHGAFPWKAPKIVVGHSCILSWWQAVHGCEAPPEWDEYREAVMVGLHSADLIVAPSRAMLESLDEHYGPLTAASVIPNGRRLPHVSTRLKHEFILAAGRLWDEAKNISMLAGVAPRLNRPVFFAGEVNDPAGRNTAGDFQYIHHLGCLSCGELQQWFERAAIYALPARYEPFGYSVLEAGHAGCALVLGDIPSLREVWKDAARFVSPDDPAALESTLRELIENPAETARLGENQ